MKQRMLRRVILVLLSIYLFIYPWSVLLVALDRVPVWGSWMGGVLLILQGTLVGVWLVAAYGRHGLLASWLILLLSWLIEHIGTTTGFPFGAYEYTDVLLPKVVGVVPLAIPFAWLLVVPVSMGIIEWLVARKRHHGARVSDLNPMLKVLGAATFALLLDVIIEPVSVHISGYWQWHEGVGGYYGVPLANFVAWWVWSVFLSWLLLTFRRKAPASTPPFPWLLPLLYVLNLTMFVVVNGAHAHKIPTLLGLIMLGYLGIVWLKSYRARQQPNITQHKTFVSKDEG
jgi:putative membrane protein